MRDAIRATECHPQQASGHRSCISLHQKRDTPPPKQYLLIHRCPRDALLQSVYLSIPGLAALPRIPGRARWELGIQVMGRKELRACCKAFGTEVKRSNLTLRRTQRTRTPKQGSRHDQSLPNSRQNGKLAEPRSVNLCMRSLYRQ